LAEQMSDENGQGNDAEDRGGLQQACRQSFDKKGNDPRFLVWKRAEPDSWMVWDRQIRAPAKTFYGSFYGLATGVTEEEARQVPS
jgi:hypothetical protein